MGFQLLELTFPSRLSPLSSQSPSVSSTTFTSSHQHYHQTSSSSTYLSLSVSLSLISSPKQPLELLQAFARPISSRLVSFSSSFLSLESCRANPQPTHLFHLRLPPSAATPTSLNNLQERISGLYLKMKKMLLRVWNEVSFLFFYPFSLSPPPPPSSLLPPPFSPPSQLNSTQLTPLPPSLYLPPTLFNPQPVSQS